MQRLGRISVEADPTGLAYPLLSAFQGGMLLAQVARDIASLKDAPRVAIDYVQTFAMPPAAGVLEDVTEAQRKQPGRSRKLDPNQFATARAALAAGQPVEQVAAAFGVSRATLYRHLAEHDDEQTSP
jgi:transcriptional regulator of acetoin/glycerol metabolism